MQETYQSYWEKGFEGIRLFVFWLVMFEFLLLNKFSQGEMNVFDEEKESKPGCWITVFC